MGRHRETHPTVTVTLTVGLNVLNNKQESSVCQKQLKNHPYELYAYVAVNHWSIPRSILNWKHCCNISIIPNTVDLENKRSLNMPFPKGWS